MVDKDGRHGEIQRITRAIFHLRDPESGEPYSRFKIRAATDPSAPATSPNPSNPIPYENKKPLANPPLAARNLWRVHIRLAVRCDM